MTNLGEIVTKHAHVVHTTSITAKILSSASLNHEAK